MTSRYYKRGFLLGIQDKDLFEQSSLFFLCIDWPSVQKHNGIRQSIATTNKRLIQALESVVVGFLVTRVVISQTGKKARSRTVRSKWRRSEFDPFTLLETGGHIRGVNKANRAVRCFGKHQKRAINVFKGVQSCLKLVERRRVQNTRIRNLAHVFPSSPLSAFFQFAIFVSPQNNHKVAREIGLRYNQLLSILDTNNTLSVFLLLKLVEKPDSTSHGRLTDLREGNTTN
ncbi:hypothetical protein N7510_004474 [Penicillium lagena]|uniref:uncharacterized protein n=1 Tax=Penicillium lagena TaxID=94218 RepID=UPI0025400247|nr:uncharacterized protein N7510_004474 [Penicillium lagena]KAJ5620490.1 hypothetical protein N7510_004474 [Penicillium lagena]